MFRRQLTRSWQQMKQDRSLLPAVQPWFNTWLLLVCDSQALLCGAHVPGGGAVGSWGPLPPESPYPRSPGAGPSLALASQSQNLQGVRVHSVRFRGPRFCPFVETELPSDCL